MPVISSRIRKTPANGDRTKSGATGPPSGARTPPSAAGRTAVEASSPKSVPESPLGLADGQSALLAMMKVEADARAAASVRDLQLLIANEMRRFVRARQVFVLAEGGSGPEVRAVSSLPVVDRTSPLVSWIEALARRHSSVGTATAVPVDPLADGDTSGPAASYPFRAMVLLPLVHRGGSPIGGILLARETPWTEADLAVAKRLADVFGHSWSALEPRPRRPLWTRIRLRTVGLSAAILGALLLVPVPLTALAPAEVAARGAFVVAAPIDGTIETVDVKPNEPVTSGRTLVRLTDTTLRNRLEVAEREVTVAEARLKQATQVAFSDPRGMHELGITRAELALKIAERNFARDVLARSVLRAPRDGIAVFSDARELTGKPVATGERLMEIADPGEVELKIELPVADAITLTAGARVLAYLDADPLRPFPATLERSDYKARPADNGTAAFRLVAGFARDGRSPPRLGVRGTAQISGERVPLGFYLFRRPIAAFRQWSGL